MHNIPSQNVIVFGSSGKVGSAVALAMADDSCKVIALDHSACDVCKEEQVRSCIEEFKPGIVINAVAYNGIDVCEDNPNKAMMINTLFPKLLAELSVSHAFLLVHISSDAVFSGIGNYCYNESSNANPINIYGFTKYGGDCFVSAIAKNYYIARISLQFGVTSTKSQFVEKMLKRIQNGEKHLKISDNIFASPSYSRDVAERIKKLIYTQSPFGFYHIANEGKASLYELICELVRIIESDVVVEPVPHSTFPSRSLKNIHTPICSEKIAPLRPWQDALMAYCLDFQAKDKGQTHG